MHFALNVFCCTWSLIIQNVDLVFCKASCGIKIFVSWLAHHAPMDWTSDKTVQLMSRCLWGMIISLFFFKSYSGSVWFVKKVLILNLNKGKTSNELLCLCRGYERTISCCKIENVLEFSFLKVFSLNFHRQIAEMITE